MRRITATRMPATPSSMPARQSRGSSGRQKGSRRSNRAMAPNIRAASRTERVIGPATATDEKLPNGHCGTRPKLGLKPTTPHQAAGMRIEPPASVPICSGPKCAAAAAPAPEEEPPGVRIRSQGLRVMPCSGQSPGDFQPNSVVVVLPKITAPAAFSPITAGASCAMGAVEEVRLPRRVAKPARSSKSFTVAGTPSSAPIGRPAIHRASLSPAAARARGFIAAKAFTHGFMRATRSSTSFSTSTGERERARKAATRSSAPIRAGSILVMAYSAGAKMRRHLPQRTGQVAAPRLTHLPHRSVAQSGSAPVWGTGGRGFESRRSDQNPAADIAQ